jgi:hypothetical protein
VERVVVATNDPAFATSIGTYDRVTVELDGAGVAFHFGRRLLELIERHELRHPLYFGGAAAPLLAPESLEDLCADLLRAERQVIANNLGSADFFGFTPADALRRIDLPSDQDNSVPRLLTRLAGLRGNALEPSIESTFDLDTPTDLAVLKLLETAKTHVRHYLDTVNLEGVPLERAMPHLVSFTARLTLIGRVDTGIWGVPAPDVASQPRIFAEERAMKASGREARGEVRTLIGHLLEAVGPQRLFTSLAELSTAVFFDTRVLFHHLHLDLSDNDRFASDLQAVDAIADPTARAFTTAARDCEVPVVLGGRNVVSGGLWALTQEAWNRADTGMLAAHG